MTERFEKQAIMPEHLRQRTIATMPFDTPYYITAEYDPVRNWEDMGGVVWVDKTSGRLRALSDTVLDEDDRESTKSDLPEKVAIMRAEILDESNRLHVGLIADLRHTLPGVLEVNDDEESPDDQEEWMEWMKQKERTVDFVAFATADESLGDDVPTDHIVLSGDPLYYDALRYLMQQVDALSDEGVQDVAKDESDESEKNTIRNKVRRVLGKLAGRG